MKSRRLWTRHAAFIIVIGVLASIVTAGAVIAGPKFLKKSKYKNTTGIYATAKGGPVDLTPNLTQVAALNVPKGNYAINAKVVTENLVDSDREYVCELRAPNTLDVSQEGDGVDSGENHLTIPLQAAQAFGGNGTIAVFCSDNGPAADNDDKAKFIKITAIRSRTLSFVASP